MPLTPKQMIKFLQDNGFEKIPNSGGSHQKMYNPITKRRTTVPMHKDDLDKGTEQAILKQAGLKSR